MPNNEEENKLFQDAEKNIGQALTIGEKIQKNGGN